MLSFKSVPAALVLGLVSITAPLTLPLAPTAESPAMELPANAGERLVLEMRGTATGEMRLIDGVMLNCFDIDLVDLATGKVIGTASDCLDVNTISGGNPMLGEGFAITNTSFFHLPGGSLKSRNRTTIQPVVDGAPGKTHVTGSVPDQGNILWGSRRFANAQGMVRLQGAVDMSRFFSENVISFSCLFVIELD